MPGCQLFVRVGVCYYEVAFNVIHTYPLGLVPVLARAMGTYPPSAAAALLGQCARHALAVRGGELCERHLHHALTASLNTVLIRIYAQNVQIRGQFYDSQTNTVCAAIFGDRTRTMAVFRPWQGGARRAPRRRAPWAPLLGLLGRPRAGRRRHAHRRGADRRDRRDHHDHGHGGGTAGAPPHNGCVVSAWTSTTPSAKSCGTTHAATWERKVMRAPPGAGAAA